jgi:hypothetical protein
MSIRFMSSVGRLGVILIIVSIVTVGCWVLWSNTRSWNPVNIPIILSEGNQIKSDEFLVNLTGRYFINIHAKGALSFNELACSLGVTDLGQGPCSKPPAINLSWAVMRSGSIIAHGTTDNFLGGGGAERLGVDRTIGYFQGQRGFRYTLDVTVLKDGTSLAVANPRLIVSANEAQLASNIVWGGLLKFSCIVLFFIGLTMIIGSLRSGR